MRNEEKAQITVEGLVMAFIAAVVFIILASTLWVAMDNELGDDIDNAQFGGTARTLLNMTIMLIIPIILIAGAAGMLKQKQQEY